MGNTNSSGFKQFRVERKKRIIVPGDHIFTSRRFFCHHGIFIGKSIGEDGVIVKDRVIHLQNALDDKMLGSTRDRHPPCLECGHHSGKSGVVESCLDCFRRGGKMYRYIYGVRLPWMPVCYMTVCTSADSDAPETIIYRAKLMLRNGFGKYDLLRNNCENFALYCKTGQYIRSGQVMLPLLLPLAVLMAMVCPFLLPCIDLQALRVTKTSSKKKPSLGKLKKKVLGLCTSS